MNFSFRRPLPFCIYEGEPWDGVTYRSGHPAKSASAALTDRANWAVVGPGSWFPAGFSRRQLIRLARGVKAWRIDANLEVIVKPDDLGAEYWEHSAFRLEATVPSQRLAALFADEYPGANTEFFGAVKNSGGGVEIAAVTFDPETMDYAKHTASGLVSGSRPAQRIYACGWNPGVQVADWPWTPLAASLFTLFSTGTTGVRAVHYDGAYYPALGIYTDVLPSAKWFGSGPGPDYADYVLAAADSPWAVHSSRKSTALPDISSTVTAAFCGQEVPVFCDEPDSGDGVQVETTGRVEISVATYWDYDPEDGLGPIVDEATGEALRQL